MLRAVLFDLDGTLIDTAPDLVNALNKVLVFNGEPAADYDYVSHFASHGTLGLLRRALGSRLEEFDVELLRQQFLDYYAENLAVESALYQGVEALICALDKAQIPWGIVTNKPAFLTNPLVPQFNQLAACQVIISGDTCGVAKPHPLPMTTAAEALGIAPEQIIYVGDAERDMQAGNKVGMTTLLASWGYIDELDEPETWQANSIIQQPLQVLDWLK